MLPLQWTSGKARSIGRTGFWCWLGMTLPASSVGVASVSLGLKLPFQIHIRVSGDIRMSTGQIYLHFRFLSKWKAVV